VGIRFLDLGQPQVIFVVLLSFLLPLSIFVGRRNVRVRQLRMLDNLDSVLRHVPADDSRPPWFSRKEGG
jgi:hypothetical protein